MEKLPAEILLHIFALGELELSDFKNLRLAGNKQLTAFLTPQVFETLTVTLTENGLKRLGQLLGIEEDDALFLRTAEQLYMQDPIDRPHDQDWDGIICNRIESISQEEIPSMVRNLHIRSIPTFEVLTEDQLRLFSRSWGGNMDEFWEHYCALMETQGENEGKLKYGGYGVAALMLALAGGLPKLETVSLQSEMPYGRETWLRKLLKKVKFGCENSFRQGWAIMFHGLAQRSWIMKWQEERNKGLFGDEDKGILPITKFHLGDVDLLGTYQMFPGWRERYKNPYEEGSDPPSRMGFPRAIQREPYLFLLGSEIGRHILDGSDDPDDPEGDPLESGGHFEKDVGIQIADPPEIHFLRWQGFAESFNVLHLEMLTVFSVSLCPYHYSSGQDARVMFNYGRWILTKQYDVADGVNEIPEVAPWSVALHAMRNLKHLHLSSSIPQLGSRRWGSDNVHHSLGSQILHPVVSTSTPEIAESDGYLRCRPSSQSFPGTVFEDARDDNIFFKLNYPELEVDIIPGEKVDSVKHGKRWQDLIDADWETLGPGKYVSSRWFAKSSGFWPYLETFSLSGFTIHVAYLQVLLITNKNTLKNIALHDTLLVTPDHCDNYGFRHRYDSGINLPSNPQFGNAEEYSKATILSLWERQLLGPDRYDTLVSTLSHISSLPNINLVSFTRCHWVAGYTSLFFSERTRTKKFDSFWYALLEELLKGEKKGKVERLDDEVMNDLYYIYNEEEMWEIEPPPPSVLKAKCEADDVEERHCRDRKEIMKVFQMLKKKDCWQESRWG